MARIKSSGLIQSISGKVGDIVFVRHRGTLTVRGSPGFTDARTDYQLKMCQRLGIRHTTTKVRHPWTNGYVERLNETLLDEFYSLAFRKKRYGGIEELQVVLNLIQDYGLL